MRRLILYAAALLAPWPAPAPAAELPGLFVHLHDVDPSIQQDMRYGGPHNFIGRPVDGYARPRCILTLPAALALSQAQKALRPKGLSLKVYDCYRPVRAVKHFVRWAKDPADDRMRRVFYAKIPKEKLLQGYISGNSRHSRGATVDLTLVPIGSSQPALTRARVASSRCAAPKQRDRIPDNSVDMGTGYDCFDTRSHTKSPDIAASAQRNRQLLVRVMNEAGFTNYRREWWHFELRGDTNKKAFDFVVE